MPCAIGHASPLIGVSSLQARTSGKIHTAYHYRNPLYTRTHTACKFCCDDRQTQQWAEQEPANRYQEKPRQDGVLALSLVAARRQLSTLPNLTLAPAKVVVLLAVLSCELLEVEAATWTSLVLVVTKTEVA